MKLFETITIRGMTLKNRIVMPPMMVGVGYRSRRARAYYAERARGGAGTIIVCATYVDVFASDNAWGRRGGAAEFIESVRSLPDAVHEAGAKIGIQLVHLNRFPLGLSVQDTRGEPVAPSPRRESDPPAVFLKPGEEMRELTIGEIEAIIANFAQAAVGAKEAGFDFVELHGAHGYLLSQFFEPACNQRSDKYGGDLTGRMRLGIECTRATRQAVGDDYPIFFRLGAEGEGVTIDDSSEFAIQLEKAGIDVIDVSRAGHVPSPIPTSEYPMGTFIHLAEAIKRRVKIPVIGVGRINTPEVAEAILSGGKADLVAIGRQLIADPFWPEKVAAGKIDEITPCLSCNMCLVDRDLTSDVARCTVNASACREEEYRLRTAETPKKILVVGGGPAGMEAARVAAMRGHDVTLYEKKDRLGGQLLLAGVVPGKDVINKLSDYLASQMEKTGVQVKPGEEVTAKFVEESKPDVVIMATGVTKFIPDIPGVGRDNVVLAEDVLTGHKDVGEKVLIIGGELVGCDVAEFLAERGKRVAMVRRGPSIAAKMPLRLRPALLDRLTTKGVAMVTGVKYEEITQSGLVIISKEGERQTIEADTIVLAAGARPNNELAKELEGKVAALYLLGDCVEPRRIREAISDGARVGREI